MHVHRAVTASYQRQHPQLLLLLVPQTCLEALQQGLATASAADAAALRSLFPFTAPPFAAGGPDSVPEAACAEGSLLSPAFGGECIDCSNAVTEVGDAPIVMYLSLKVLQIWYWTVGDGCNHQWHASGI
jgi:hypothetical protein